MREQVFAQREAKQIQEKRTQNHILIVLARAVLELGYVAFVARNGLVHEESSAGYVREVLSKGEELTLSRVIVLIDD